MRAMVVGLVLVAGCFATIDPPASWNRLSDDEKNTFGRCANQMVQSQCQASNAAMDRSICWQFLATKYSEEPTEDARKTWLIGHGCPPSMVRPEAY